MHLPEEIIDHILSFLQSDTVSLKACSHSHPLLFRLAERHLYTQITVDSDGNVEESIHPGTKLTVVLSKKPQTVNHVRSLEIQMSFNFAKSNVSYSRDLISILPKLLLLNKITLSGSWAGRAMLRWKLVPKEFKLVFLDYLRRSPSINDVCVRRIIGFPLSALNYCSTIKALTLDGSTVDPRTIISGKSPLLESLSILRCSRESLNEINHWVNTRNLHSLEFSRPCRDFMAANPANREFLEARRLIVDCSNSLTNLTIDIGDQFRQTYKFWDNGANHPTIDIPLTLSFLPHLENLTIRAEPGFHFNTMSGILPDITLNNFSSSIPAITRLVMTAACLKHLTLDFYFFIHRPNFVPEHVLWAPLVRLLSSSPSCNLRVRASKIPAYRCYTDVITSSISRCARELVDQRILVITPVMLILPKTEARPLSAPAKPSPRQVSIPQTTNVAHGQAREQGTAGQWLMRLSTFLIPLGWAK